MSFRFCCLRLVSPVLSAVFGDVFCPSFVIIFPPFISFFIVIQLPPFISGTDGKVGGRMYELMFFFPFLLLHVLLNNVLVLAIFF